MENSDSKLRNYFHKTLLVPFGRYSQESERTGPGYEQFVGREDERAFLIDALTTKGRQGAYLITGRRGIGKTSFVNSCLAEYEQAVFRRYLRLENFGSLTSILSVISVMALIIFLIISVSNFLELRSRGLDST